MWKYLFGEEQGWSLVFLISVFVFALLSIAILVTWDLLVDIPCIERCHQRGLTHYDSSRDACLCGAPFSVQRNK